MTPESPEIDTPLPARRPVRLKGYDYSRSGAYFVTMCTQDRACMFGEVSDGLMRLNEYGQIVHACWLEMPDHFPHVELDTFVVMPNHTHGIIRIERARHAVPLRDTTSQPDASAASDAIERARHAVPLRDNMSPPNAEPVRDSTEPDSTIERHEAGSGEGFGKPTAGSVPTIVRSFKAAVTKRINEIRGTAGTACRAPTGQPIPTDFRAPTGHPGSTKPRIWQRGYYEHVIRDDKTLSEIRQYIADNPMQWALDCENPLAEAAPTSSELGGHRDTA